MENLRTIHEETIETIFKYLKEQEKILSAEIKSVSEEIQDLQNTLFTLEGKKEQCRATFYRLIEEMPEKPTNYWEE